MLVLIASWKCLLLLFYSDVGYDLVIHVKRVSRAIHTLTMPCSSICLPLRCFPHYDEKDRREDAELKPRRCSCCSKAEACADK